MSFDRVSMKGEVIKFVHDTRCKDGCKLNEEFNNSWVSDKKLIAYKQRLYKRNKREEIKRAHECADKILGKGMSPNLDIPEND